MKFGKEFNIYLEETLPEWKDKFLCYKPLKKLLKNLPANPADAPRSVFADTTNTSAAALDPLRYNQEIDGLRAALQDWFVRILNEELEKFNDFFLEKEGDFIIQFHELKERINQVKETNGRGGVFTSESEFSEEIMDIRRDLVIIHGEMVLLKNYSALNFAGIMKILKKYDKRTGGLLRLPFTRIALRQPFFTTESLTRLVRECEENLELLFPLEAEVVEATPAAAQGEPRSPSNTYDASSNLGEETMDVYRSTLAAMKAIRGLQNPSSTRNPLSFSSLVRRREDDNSAGAVTAENSAASSVSSQNDKETNKEDAQSVSRSP